MSSPLATVDFGGTTITQSDHCSLTIFVAKYNMDGTLAWAKAIGSAKSSSYTYGGYGRDIKIGSYGSAYGVDDFMQKSDFYQDGVHEISA